MVFLSPLLVRLSFTFGMLDICYGGREDVVFIYYYLHSFSFREKICASPVCQVVGFFLKTLILFSPCIYTFIFSLVLCFVCK